jgi:hypothetical protein
MVGKSKYPTRTEARRMELIGQQYFGCIPCRLEEPSLPVLATVQHVVEGYRLGHMFTYGCCLWHHLGQFPSQPGPSLAHNRKGYRQRYGSERLLIALQDFVIEIFEREPWFEYEMPDEVAFQLQDEWVKLRADDPYFEER